MTRDIKIVHTPKPVAKQGHMYECHAKRQHQSQWGQSFSGVVSFPHAFSISKNFFLGITAKSIRDRPIVSSIKAKFDDQFFVNLHVLYKLRMGKMGINNRKVVKFRLNYRNYESDILVAVNIQKKTQKHKNWVGRLPLPHYSMSS